MRFFAGPAGSVSLSGLVPREGQPAGRRDLVSVRGRAGGNG